jgi:hypothetical protein
MPMNYTTLTGGKGAAGSIMNWVSYTKLDVGTVVDEAQSLLFQSLRVREMRTEWTFGLGVGQSSIPVPARFLDPIGRLYDVSNGMWLGHKLEGDILSRRAYVPVAGSFGADPFTTFLGAPQVVVSKTAIGLNQGSTITISGASDVNGLTLNGTFPVTSQPANTGPNSIILVFDTAATAAGTGGGAAATYTGNNLVAGSPSQWSIWDEKFAFDTALDVATTYKQIYYRAPLPLSATNLSNFLTDRYPMLMRKACMAAAADFMKDDTEYQKQVSALNNLIQSTAAGDDLIYRGAEFGTDTP